LVIAAVKMPSTPRALAPNDALDPQSYPTFDPKITVLQKINHDGEVNRFILKFFYFYIST